MRSETSGPIRYDRIIGGLAVVLVGIFGWLYELGHVSWQQLLGLWPLTLVGIGLCHLADRNQPRRGGARLAVLAGSLLLLGNLLTPDGHYLEIRFGFLPLRLSWPLLLVVLGTYIAGRDYFVSGPTLEEKR